MNTQAVFKLDNIYHVGDGGWETTAMWNFKKITWTDKAERKEMKEKI